MQIGMAEFCRLPTSKGTLLSVLYHLDSRIQATGRKNKSTGPENSLYELIYPIPTIHMGSLSIMPHIGRQIGQIRIRQIG